MNTLRENESELFDRVMKRLRNKGVDTGNVVAVVTDLETEINQYRDQITHLEEALVRPVSQESMELARLKDAIVKAWVKEHGR